MGVQMYDKGYRNVCVMKTNQPAAVAVVSTVWLCSVTSPAVV